MSERRCDLICFDVDGTLVHHPEDKVIWQLLHDRYLGSDALNEQRRADFMAGRISYARWVELDVLDWQQHGVTREDILTVVRELRVVQDAVATLRELDRRGYRLAVISGTLDVVLSELLPEPPFVEVFTNRIRFDGSGRISGWTATPFDMEGKAVALAQIAGRLDVEMSRSAFVGDHLNDVAAARAAGTAVAFNPKSDDLVEACDGVIDGPSLAPLLEWFP